ncbi:zf-TFIIB domain-containing protein [bacterium]|nr:zf-TFIIB domain-containing protein [bacterium]
MKCPVCKDVDLKIADRQGIEIDYCPQCRGVWLDRGELDKIIERSARIEREFEAPPARPLSDLVEERPRRDVRDSRGYFYDDDDTDHPEAKPKNDDRYRADERRYDDDRRRYDDDDRRYDKRRRKKSMLEDLFDIFD